MSDPFRNVVHIAEDTGPRGGPYWNLTLECGHHAFRPRRVPRLEDANLGGLVAMDTKTRRPKYTAPHQVKCLHCEINQTEASHPEDSPARTPTDDPCA